MRKLMLVMDDFSDLVATESLLRRLGFDVLSVAKEVLVNDAILSFPPDLCVATFRGRSVDGLRLAARLKKQFPSIRVALTVPSGAFPSLPESSQSVVDAFLEMPAQPAAVIPIIAQLAGVSPESLIERFDRFAGGRKLDADAETSSDTKTNSSMLHVTGSIVDRSKAANHIRGPGQGSAKKSIEATTSSESTARLERYDRFLAEHDEPVTGVLPKNTASLAMEKLKNDSRSERADLDRNDEAKRVFAKVLFMAGSGASTKKLK